MFFFFRTYAYILIAAAIIPAIILLKKVYTADHLEPEPPALIARLVLFGVISTYIALILEKIGLGILDSADAAGKITTDNQYYFYEFFLIVGPAEEIAKYVMLRVKSWKDENFNCQFDAIVYSVSVSLGFALWENIRYVFSYGFGTALVRAITAIPGHACFGVFMGVWYGVAKRQEVIGNHTASLIFRGVAIVCAALIHGAYDYLATVSDNIGNIAFIVFIVAIFFVALRSVKHLADKDRYLDPNDPNKMNMNL